MWSRDMRVKLQEFTITIINKIIRKKTELTEVVNWVRSGKPLCTVNNSTNKKAVMEPHVV